MRILVDPESGANIYCRLPPGPRSERGGHGTAEVSIDFSCCGPNVHERRPSYCATGELAGAGGLLTQPVCSRGQKNRNFFYF